MTVKTSYEPGEPIWVDLATPDMDATTAFYGSLFGWSVEPGPAEFGGYSSFTKQGHVVAGVMPLMQEGQPPVWTCYLCTTDSDKTAARVAEAGGVVHAPPMAVADLGTMCIFADPAGAFLGSWQPGTHRGAELVHEEGTLTWVELSSRDQAAALPFYRAAFGLGAKIDPGYTELQLDDRSVAGLMDMPDGVPAEVPSYWMPYFTAQDPAAKADEVIGLGGSLRVPLQEMEQLSFTVVADPHGSVFGLLHMKD